MNALIEMARLVEWLRAIPGATDATVRVQVGLCPRSVALALVVYANRVPVTRVISFDRICLDREPPGWYDALVEDAVRRLTAAVREVYLPAGIDMRPDAPFEPMRDYAVSMPPRSKESEALAERMDRLMKEPVRPFLGVERVGNEHTPEFADGPTVIPGSKFPAPPPMSPEESADLHRRSFDAMKAALPDEPAVVEGDRET